MRWGAPAAAAGVGLGLCWTAVLLVASFAIEPGISPEAGVRSTLLSLHAAQQQAKSAGELDRDGDGISEYLTLQQLAGADPAYIPSYLASGRREGYVFHLTVGDGVDGSADAAETSWFIVAVPETPRRGRTLYIDETGEVRATDDPDAPLDRASAERWPIAEP